MLGITSWHFFTVPDVVVLLNNEGSDVASIGAIAETLRGEAASGMKPKDLMAAVRRKHPDVSKKEIVRAAFYALIESHSTNAEHLSDLHNFAIGERASDEETEAKSRKLRKKRKKHAAEPGTTTAAH